MDPGKPTVQTRALWRALEIVGGKEALRALLRVSMRELNAWLQGSEKPPMDVFLKAVDIISAPTVRSPNPEIARARLLKQQSHKLMGVAQRAMDQASAIQQAHRATRASLPAVSRFLTRWFEPTERTAMLDAALGAALEAARAPMGNVQLREPDGLHIVVHRGFKQPFLEFFACVHEGQWCCGTAKNTAQRVVTNDVASDPLFAGTEAAGVMEAAGARACQSTPLVGTTGEVLGVLSTHYEHPGVPAEVNFAAIDEIARRAAFWLEQPGVTA